jgi:transposase
MKMQQNWQGYFNRDLVRYVVMDMWRPYRQAVETMLPDATVVIDKFHVVRMANQSLDVSTHNKIDTIST